MRLLILDTKARGHTIGKIFHGIGCEVYRQGTPKVWYRIPDEEPSEVSVVNFDAVLLHDTDAHEYSPDLLEKTRVFRYSGDLERAKSRDSWIQRDMSGGGSISPCEAREFVDWIAEGCFEDRRPRLLRVPDSELLTALAILSQVYLVYMTATGSHRLTEKVHHAVVHIGRTPEVHLQLPTATDPAHDMRRAVWWHDALALPQEGTASYSPLIRHGLNHCRELLDRVAGGQDILPPLVVRAYAELVEGCEPVIPSKRWARARKELIHDWLSGKDFIGRLFLWRRVLEGHVQGDAFGISDVRGIVSEWNNRLVAIQSLIENLERSMSPRTLLDRDPLRQIPGSLSAWAKLVVHKLWVERAQIHGMVAEAQAAMDITDETFRAIAKKLTPSVRSADLGGTFNTVECCSLVSAVRRLRDAIDAFPSHVRIA
jgi:hypothetical protein